MILVIGEALIDLIENRYQPGSFNAIVGGANANVAIALARRGTEHTLYARISTDRFGQLIRQRLDDNNVNYQNSITTNENSTLAIVSINEAGSPTYSFYVNGTADWGWTKEELPTNDQLKEMGVTCIQFGCLTMAMEPGNRVIEAWAQQTENITISHDINIRAALGFDPQTEQQRVERINVFSHIIKASDEDLEWLYQTKEIDEIAANWSANKLVLITKGPDGTDVYRNNKKLFNVPSRKVNVVDTVGAGDTFTANLIAQLQENNLLANHDALMNLDPTTLHTYVHIAGIAASITCERPGCEPPTRAELLSTLKLVWGESPFS